MNATTTGSNNNETKHFAFNMMNSTNYFPERTNMTITAVEEDAIDIYEIPKSLVIVLSILYGAIILTALLGNSLVIYVVIVSPRMRTVTNFYIANLAFADVTIAMFAFPFQFHAALMQRWDLPEFMCKFCPTVGVLSVNISIFTLVALALDRYRAIMHPLKRKPGKLISVSVILLIWLFSFAFALPMGLVYHFRYIPDGTQYHNGTQWIEYSKPFCQISFDPNNTSINEHGFKYYSVSLVIVEYFLPLSIISFAYARICINLWGNKTPGESNDQRDQQVLGNKKKVIKMLVIVVTIFAVCWMPWQTWQTTSLIQPNVNKYRYINVIFFCCHWLAMSNSCYNPIIYGIFSEKFRKEFASRVPCLRILDRSPEPNLPTATTKTTTLRATTSTQNNPCRIQGFSKVENKTNSNGSALKPLLEDQDNASVDGSRSNTIQLHPINNPSGKAIDAKIKFLNKSQEENASIPAKDIISRS